MNGGDERWMDLALAEAAKGVGRTAPNPPVGAVVVRDGALIGRGYHRAAGSPHAEREALADARVNHGADAVRGATVVVTLEPCSTQGRTPPCTQALIDAGIARVVYAVVDRNPSHCGRADGLLRAAGIEVVSGVRQCAAEHLLRSFFKVRETGLPWVIWKAAMSLDGRLTRPPGEGQWLTGEEARHDVQRLRGEVDAILTSGETVRRDRPALTIRVPEFLAGRPQPWRVVFSNRPESLPQDAPLFGDAWRERTLVRSGDGLSDSLRRLAEENGVLTAMVEAGGVFSGAMLAAGLIDEVVVYIAPRICGGPAAAISVPAPAGPLRLEEISWQRFGDDIRLRGLIGR
jgi:diaminohydroxyphosphoribosylaminopyrimidine deaminase / 5-amino-6-(5-phosphoribosylamino)uracil reductase